VSKESKPRDRYRQSIEAVRDRPLMFCNGCGYYPVTNQGQHRADCPRITANGDDR
jgi:TPP-dependent indolepyruvate ferredoxin oxidoreductase alpha subunit